MLIMRSRSVLPLLFVALAACGDDDDAPEPACDAGTLAGRLEGAQAGDTVEVGACRIEGEFVVPEGVTIEGAGRDATVIVGPAGDDSIALTLEPGLGEGTTVARDLSVETRSKVGIRAQGAGRVLVERVTVTADRGVAVGIIDPSWLVLRELSLLGPVTPENVGSVEEETSATHGLVVISSAETTIENLSARGFAQVGVLLYDSSGTWRDGEVTENLGLGFGQWAGSVSLQDVSVTRTLQGTGLTPSYAMVLADGADLDSTGLVVDDNDQYGILQASATARHIDLLARRNGEAAMWMQGSESLVMQGCSLDENSFGGLVAVSSSGIDIQDTSISATAFAPTIVEGTTIEVGDGIHLVGSTDDVLLDGVTLTGNQRAGMLIDLDGGSTDGIDLVSVTVEGVDEQYGVIAQSGTTTEGWDEQVTRLGDTLANDETFFADALRLGVSGTTDVPSTDEDQLRGLLGPNE